MTRASDERPHIERRMLRERRFPATLVPILANLKVVPRPSSYCVVKLPSGAKAPASAGDARRLSVAWADQPQSFILPETEWNSMREEFGDAEVEKGFRILWLSVVPDGHEGSFMAVVTGMLADALVNARPSWSPGQFELIVKGSDLKQTRDALDLIVSRAKGRLRGA
ncbi:MAG: hypothetical protein HYY25_13090 [Candidatus Wallbacteria bacterium]|nr:hypothetical protein [Candidatus Wallbacteria bacterium]